MSKREGMAQQFEYEQQTFKHWRGKEGKSRAESRLKKRNRTCGTKVTNRLTKTGV